MNYAELKNMVIPKEFDMKRDFNSFCIIKDKKPYIEPDFKKIIWNVDSPSVIFVSAIGASGKTALSKRLSMELKIPLLDLAIHKAVADSTLTGILLNTFDEDSVKVRDAIKQGHYCIVIDALDEGRAKITESGFIAFLDTIIDLSSKHDGGVSFLVLGRTNILDDSYLYIESKGVKANLISLEPFSLDKAKSYIDVVCNPVPSNDSNYILSRDLLIEKLGRSFKRNEDEESVFFRDFMGYPPVLDAIATLLSRTSNYYKLHQDIDNEFSQDSEGNLLAEIARFILCRERDAKVKPNIIFELSKLDSNLEIDHDTIFDDAEQCIRLMHFVTKTKLEFQAISNDKINALYEDKLKDIFMDHPFLNGNKFRNPVLEAFVIAKLMALPHSYKELLDNFFLTHKTSYHLLHMYKTLAEEPSIVKVPYISYLTRSAQEFGTSEICPVLTLKSDSWEEAEFNHEDTSFEVDMHIEIFNKNTQLIEYDYDFSLTVCPNTVLHLGENLSYADIDIPCSLELSGKTEIKLIPSITIHASSVSVHAPTLLMPPYEKDEGNNALYVRCKFFGSFRVFSG